MTEADRERLRPIIADLKARLAAAAVPTEDAR